MEAGGGEAVLKVCAVDVKGGSEFVERGIFVSEFGVDVTQEDERVGRYHFFLQS